MSQNLTESAHAVTAKEMPSALGFHLGLSAVGSVPGTVSVPLSVNQQSRSCLLSLPSGHSDCLVFSAVCCDAFVPTREGSVPVTALLLSQLQPQMMRAAQQQLMAPPCGPRQPTMAAVWAPRAGEVLWTLWPASTVVTCLVP